MQTAVWDTYVKRRNGNVMHFDIIVPDTIKDPQVIYSFGKTYLNEKDEIDSKLDIEECQFCHIEEQTLEMKAAITKQGYYILEMDEIPSQLPLNPTKRDLILHLKAHNKNYRFASFKGKSIEEIQEMLGL